MDLAEATVVCGNFEGRLIDRDDAELGLHPWASCADFFLVAREVEQNSIVLRYTATKTAFPTSDSSNLSNGLLV